MNGSPSLRNRLNATVRDIPRSGIRDFFDIVTTMKDVISLGIGEPDFDTPWHVRESTVFALERGATHYTSNYRLPRTCAAPWPNTSARHSARNTIPENEMLITVGVSEALDLALRALVNPGDEVLYHEPCYVSYRATILFAHGAPVAVETNAEERVSPHARDAGGQGHAAHEGADAQFPEQPDRRRHEPGRIWRTSPRSPASATSSSSRTKSTAN